MLLLDSRRFCAAEADADKCSEFSGCSEGAMVYQEVQGTWDIVHGAGHGNRHPYPNNGTDSTCKDSKVSLCYLRVSLVHGSLVASRPCMTCFLTTDHILISRTDRRATERRGRGRGRRSCCFCSRRRPLSPSSDVPLPPIPDSPSQPSQRECCLIISTSRPVDAPFHHSTAAFAR